MNFSFETTIPAITVFLQGLLSFFSPCVLPLIPLYISYFAGGAKTVDKDGTIHYPRGRILFHTLAFVLGISMTFFLLGFGFTALGQFFSDNRSLLAKISGIIMILFGLYQVGIFGRSEKLDQERRLPFRLDRLAMSPLTAFLLGFTFSFAWTPCVGPVLAGVLLMAGSTGNAAKGFFLIAVYTLGFILPFLTVGLFTGTVLDFFKVHRSVVRYTVKIGAVLLILMGLMTLTGFMNGLTGYLSRFGSSPQTRNQTDTAAETVPNDDTDSQPAADAAPDFTLTDQYGNSHTLSDYRGKTVFLNFWATWCPPCRNEMPEIQALYEKYGENTDDLIVLGIAAPDIGNEGSREEIAQFLSDNGYTFPVVMDVLGLFTSRYGISAYPTTFMIASDGRIYGYVEGGMTAEMMESIVEQTMEGAAGSDEAPNRN